MEFLRDKGLHADVNQKDILFLNCLDFRGARYDKGNHYGQATRILRNVIEYDRRKLQVILEKISKELQENSRITHLVFWCSHGKHRSVAAATLTQHALEKMSSQWHVQERVDLMQNDWSQWKCFWVPCAECDRWNQEKEKCFCRTFNMLEDAWKRFTPGLAAMT